jgi:uncharacterized membrane protein
MVFLMLFFIGKTEAPSTPFINVYTLIIALIIAVCNASYWYKEDQYRKGRKDKANKADRFFNIFMISLFVTLVATHS